MSFALRSESLVKSILIKERSYDGPLLTFKSRLSTTRVSFYMLDLEGLLAVGNRGLTPNG